MTKPTDESLAEIAKYEALAEKAFAEMHESRSPRGPYADMKDYYVDAIAAAERAGLAAEAKRLREALMQRMRIYRSQFGNF
jgi:hypothetical protein